MHWLGVLSEGQEKRVEPYFCLNFGTGTLDEALAWVEYCNGTRNTYYANLRRKNGREEPYNIKYWALGNEVHLPSTPFSHVLITTDVGTLASRPNDRRRVLQASSPMGQSPSPPRSNPLPHSLWRNRSRNMGLQSPQGVHPLRGHAQHPHLY